MIAQQILTNATNTKQQAAHQQPAATNGFLSALSATDSSLTDLAQNMGASAASAAALPANGNKSNKTADLTATPYIAAPTPTIPPTAPLIDSALSSINGNAIPSNPVLPATAPAADASTGTDAGATATTAPGTNGNSTAFGADQLNARVAAGAPIYAAQPSAALASVPPQVIEQANARPQPAAAATASDAAALKPSLNAASVPAHVLDQADTHLMGGTTTDGSDSAAQKSSATPTPQLPSAATTASDAAPALPTPTLGRGTTNGETGSFVAANSSADAAARDSDTADDTDASATPGAALVAQPGTASTAPMQTDAAVHTAAPYVPVGEQVALNVKQALATGNNEIRIQLKPESLGTIDVKINVNHDGRLTAVISADRSDTLNMLKQDSGALQQSLRDAGINADSGSLSFNLRGDAQSFAQNSSQGGAGNSGGGYATAASNALSTADTATPSQRVHSGSLDIEV